VIRKLSGINLQIYIASYENAVSAVLEQQYLAMMPTKLCASMARYKRWQDRQATLFGKLLLLKALRKIFHDDWMHKLQSLEVSRHGKPFIHGGPEFNISHSEGMVVVAVTRQKAIGIDIEKIRAINISDFSHYLPEVATLHKNNTAEQANILFFDCWTRKEAVLKGCGKGLLAPLEHVVLKDDTALYCDTTWFLKKLLLDEQYCCHVATAQPPEHVAIEYVNLMNDEFLR
jgi:4'-phosphopantetheinyl transferase